jgi:hypothetical protein
MQMEAEAIYKELYLIEVSPMTFAQLCDENIMRFQMVQVPEDPSSIWFSGVKITASWTAEEGCMLGYMRRHGGQ